MESLIRDLKHALRGLLKNPAFAGIAILTLALGIGANAAIFSVVNAVVLRPLPYDDPDEIVVLWEEKDGRPWTVSPPNFRDWQEMNRSFESMALVDPVTLTLTGGDEPELLLAMKVSHEFFDALGAQPVEGRGFRAEEEQAGRERVVVISHELWQGRFGGDPAIVGQTIPLNADTFEVVGVMPESARIPYLSDPQLFVPRVITEYEMTPTERATRLFRILARLNDGVSLEQARQDMDRVSERLAQEYPAANKGWKAGMSLLIEDSLGPVKKNLYFLLAAVAVVLLIACANLVNLVLARSTGRQREMALRMALGADRRTLARQMMTETLVLTAAGGALGLLLSTWVLKIMVRFSPRTILRFEEVGIDGPVLLFTLGATLLSALLVGLLPALKGARFALVPALQEGGARSAGSVRHNRFRNALVVAQTALLMVLLVAGGLVAKSFYKLQSKDPGFQSQDRVMMSVSVPSAKYPDREAIAEFYRRALERVRAIPGVKEAGGLTTRPLNLGGLELQYFVEGRPTPDPADVPTAAFDLATPGTFEALGVPLKSGRLFSDRDRVDSPPVMIVNETLAQLVWPAESAVGKRISTAGPAGPFAEVVGVVGDVRESGMELDPRPGFYKPHPQMAYPLPYLQIVVWGEPGRVDTLPSAVRSAIWEVDPDQPVTRNVTLDRFVADSVGRQRFVLIILLAFALLAFLLGAIGIYGVVSYGVSQRKQEIGVRMALGSSAGGVLRWVLQRSLIPVALGIVLGIVVSLLAGRLLESLLFEVGASDAATIVLTALALVTVALAAILIPARRASAVDPVIALRD
ncbi:MAG: ABC transporter permease [Acidobacteriota bacterium]